MAASSGYGTKRGHSAMSVFSPLYGVKRKSDFGAVRFVDNSLIRKKFEFNTKSPLRDVRRRNEGELTSLRQNGPAETPHLLISATAVGQPAISLCPLHNRRLNSVGDKPLCSRR
jgi:hypothetical protein